MQGNEPHKSYLSLLQPDDLERGSHERSGMLPVSVRLEALHPRTGCGYISLEHRLSLQKKKTFNTVPKMHQTKALVTKATIISVCNVHSSFSNYNRAQSMKDKNTHCRN